MAVSGKIKGNPPFTSCNVQMYNEMIPVQAAALSPEQLPGPQQLLAALGPKAEEAAAKELLANGRLPVEARDCTAEGESPRRTHCLRSGLDFRLF